MGADLTKANLVKGGTVYDLLKSCKLGTLLTTILTEKMK